MFKKRSKRRDDRVIPRRDDGDDQSAFTDYVNNQWVR